MSSTSREPLPRVARVVHGLSTIDAMTFREARVAHGRFDETYSEFVLPYAQVRAASDPRAVLEAFLESTYEAAAVLGGWDRQSLERDPVAP